MKSVKSVVYTLGVFGRFFTALRRFGVPVSLNEWLLLQHALSENLADSSLVRFYHLGRGILVKNEAHYDRYDRAFLESFREADATEELVRIAEEEMLRLPPIELTENERRWLEKMRLAESEEAFLEQLRKKNFRRHQGGNRAIGVRGTSPQGTGGSNPAGIRIGRGTGRTRSALKIAGMRLYENYRDDVVLDTRSMKLALQSLRQMVREGPKEELNLDGTIDATCRNAGELEFVWRRERRRRLKLLLLMDAGGTMTPYADLVSRLFSAAKDLVRDLKYYYFHNCVYQELYTDIARRKSIPTRKVLEQVGRSYKVILVGDAYMAPSELLSPNGSMDYWYRNDRPGIEWLSDIRKRYRKSIWLNPEPKRWWDSVESTQEIRRVFPMFELTLAGLRRGVRHLLK